MKRSFLIVSLLMIFSIINTYAQCDTLNLRSNSIESRVIQELLMDMIKSKEHVVLDADKNRLTTFGIENLYRTLHIYDTSAKGQEKNIGKVISWELRPEDISYSVVCLNEGEGFAKRIAVFIKQYAETGEEKRDLFLCWLVL